MMMKKSLQRKTTVLEKELQKILSEEDTILSRAMRHAVFSGGKRYRPLLAMSSAEIFSVQEKTILPFACALELVHNYSLVHDDLPAMDDDSVRRGKPTCHKAFGEDIAILTGDSLLTLAFEVMAEAPAAEKMAAWKDRCIMEISLAAGYKGMVGGQVLDITLSSGELTEDKICELIQKKTGALITASLRIGGILGNASKKQMSALTEFGNNIGFAFQIRDDILDSSQDIADDRVFRPNSVDLWGAETAHRRLQEHIQMALDALRREEIRSEDLTFLAQLLLDLHLENNHE